LGLSKSVKKIDVKKPALNDTEKVKTPSTKASSNKIIYKIY